MEHFHSPIFEPLRWVLPIYLLVFFYLAVLRKSYLIREKIGKSPIIIPIDSSSNGIIYLYFKISIIALSGYVITFSFFPEYYNYFIPIKSLQVYQLTYLGILLGILSLIIIVKAQNDMKESWRIGIDRDTSTELVTSGLFRYSRNPIYTGLILSMIAFFLVTPNFFTLIYLILGWLFIHLHINLEEGHLHNLHDEDYENYKQNVRRFL